MLLKEGTSFVHMLPSRLIGLYCSLVALSMSVQRRVEAETIAAV
jgi:hypothetical protein